MAESSFMQLDTATLESVGRLDLKSRKTPKGRKTRKGRKETIKLLIGQYDSLQEKLAENNDVILDHYRCPTIRCIIMRAFSILAALGLLSFFYPLMPSISEGFMYWVVVFVFVLMIVAALWALIYAAFVPSADHGIDLEQAPGHYWWLPMHKKAAIKRLTREINRLSKIDQEFQAKCQELSPLVDKFSDLALVVTEELGLKYKLVKGTRAFAAKISRDGKTWESYNVSPEGYDEMAYRVAGLLAAKQKQQGIILSLNNKINELKQKGGH